MVFQSFALFPWMTVLDNVAVGLEARGMGTGERVRRAEKYIDLVGLSGYQRAFPRELSRGMKQLVGVARALALEPELLCMDEPFSALDVLSARSLRDLVLDLWASDEVATKTILLVTHSIEEAVAMSDRVVVLRANPGRFDVVLLDTDNGPAAFTAADNAGLYDNAGVAAAFAALRPGGTLAVWSAWEDRKFEQRLRFHGFRVEVARVRARLRKGGPRHTIFLAHKSPAGD